MSRDKRRPKPSDRVAIKAEICERQRWKCGMCGGDIPNPEMHHIKPIREGGSNRMGNLVGLCESCHDIADRDWEQSSRLLKAYTKLRDKPHKFGNGTLKIPVWKLDERRGEA